MEKNTTSKLRRHLFLLLMFCFAAAILGDSTAESLLLARFGAAFIPKMFLVNAAALFILSAGMLAIVDKLDRRRFFARALLIHGIILLLMRAAVAAHWNFLFLPLFSYAYSSKILFFLLFWTVANDLIDSRSAGREFPAIAAGGTIGAIVVSFSISGLMRFLSVENLLFVWSGLVIASSLMLLPLRNNYNNSIKEVKNSKKPINESVKPLRFAVMLRDEPLLRNMSLLYALIFFLLLNQHFVFYRYIKSIFSTAEMIASFLGEFNGVSMLITCIMQMSISGVLMRKLGSTRSMLLLPSALFIVFTIQLILEVTTAGSASILFLSIVAGMGVRIAFFDSFFSPNFQLFFSSLPKDMRGRSKLLIEGGVKPLSMVIAGSFLLWVAPAMSVTTHLILMACIAAMTLFQTIRLKQAYTTTLTRYLTGFDVHRKNALLSHFEFGGGEDFLSFFAKRLDNEEFEVQKYLIDIIADEGNEDAASLLLDFIDRADEKLRATVVASLGNFPAELVEKKLKTFLDDSNHRVVANAVEALVMCHSPEVGDLLPPLTTHPDSRVRINAMSALWPEACQLDRQKYLELLQDMLYSNNAKECASALYLTGRCDDETMTMLLFNFCRLKAECGLMSGSVHSQAVIALGNKKSVEALELLLLIAQHSTPLQRLLVIDSVANILHHCDENIWLMTIERQNAIYKNCLLKAIKKCGYKVTEKCLVVLSRIATREADAIEWEKQSIQQLVGSGSKRMALLSCAVREEVVSIRLENLISIAVLLDETGVINTVVPRLHHSDRHVRARAFEILENHGDTKLNRTITSCIEWLDSLPLLPETEHKQSNKKIQATAGSYCTSHNRWVAICAEYACSRV